MNVNSVVYMKSIKLLEVNFVVYMATKTEVPTKNHVTKATIISDHKKT